MISRGGRDLVSQYWAHTIPDSDRVQYLADHLRQTAALAGQFAAPFHAEQAAEQTAILHDIGKYGTAFQARIRGSKQQADHSTAGALEANRLRNIAGAFCIAGHHGGIPDLGCLRYTACQIESGAWKGYRFVRCVPGGN